MVVLLIVIGALMLISLVIAHEFGHFIAARRAGVEVEEFGIGFPPKAKTLGKKNGTEYTLNWLPLGGFVRLKGEHDADTTKGSYGAARFADKVKIMVAGVIVNAITAVLLMSVVAAIALPQVLGDTQFTVASDERIVRHDVFVASITDDSPASATGLELGDRLLTVQAIDCDAVSDGVPCSSEVTSRQELGVITSQYESLEVEVTYADESNNDAIGSTIVTLRTADEVEPTRQAADACEEAATTDDELRACPVGLGYLGVAPDDYIEKRYTWSAPIVGVVFSGQVIQETLSQFGQVIAGLFRADTQPARENVTGVLGIGYILGEIADRGLIAIIFLTAIISLSLALMNILPIPALDGGRLFVTVLFRTLKKPLTKEVEEKIHGTGFAFLMLLFVLITVLDVQRFVLN